MRTLLIALICVIIPCHIWAQDMLGEGAIIDKGNNLDENTQALEDVAAAGAAILLNARLIGLYLMHRRL